MQIEEMQTLEIPLSKLLAWNDNVRVTGVEEGIGELADSIAAVGLLKGLVVKKEQRGNFEFSKQTRSDPRIRQAHPTNKAQQRTGQRELFRVLVRYFRPSKKYFCLATDFAFFNASVQKGTESANQLESLTMQQVSVFIAECLCGRTFETPSRDYTCPDCKRRIRLEWGLNPESSLEAEKESAVHSVAEVTA